MVRGLKSTMIIKSRLEDRRRETEKIKNSHFLEFLNIQINQWQDCEDHLNFKSLLQKFTTKKQARNRFRAIVFMGLLISLRKDAGANYHFPN
jgi:hypothetical protein